MASDVRDRVILMTYSVRDAVVADLPSVMRLFEQRVRWLASMGSHQWENFRSWEGLLRRTIARHQTKVLVEDDDVVAGTITLKYHGERNFWTEQERHAGNALYLSKLATDVQRKGHGLGDLLLDWSTNQASLLRKDVLRLDAWRFAHGLHQYYKERGWAHVRTLDFEELRNSGVLFEKRVRYVPDLHKRIARTTHRSTLEQPGPPAG